MNRTLFSATLLLSGVLLLSGCGGGSSSGTTTDTSADTVSAEPISRSMDTSLSDVSTQITTSGANGALAAESLTNVATANDLMANLDSYVTGVTGKSRAVYTKQIGGLTVTLEITAVTAIQKAFTVTLNGAATQAGTGYSNFVFATGTVQRGTLSGKRGTHETVAYNQLRDGGQAAPLATADNWFFDDGSGQGNKTFTASSNGVYLTYTYDAAHTWNWSAYTGGDATTGKLKAQVIVNPDHSGTAKVYCNEDGKLRIQADWTAAKTGQVCVFPTACSLNADAPCVSYPRTQ